MENERLMMSVKRLDSLKLLLSFEEVKCPEETSLGAASLIDVGLRSQ